MESESFFPVTTILSHSPTGGAGEDGEPYHDRSSAGRLSLPVMSSRGAPGSSTSTPGHVPGFPRRCALFSGRTGLSQVRKYGFLRRSGCVRLWQNCGTTLRLMTWTRALGLVSSLMREAWALGLSYSFYYCLDRHKPSDQLPRRAAPGREQPIL
jgi:hypothetical protein